MASFKKLNSVNLKIELAGMSKDVILGNAMAIDLMLVLKEVQGLIDELYTTHEDEFLETAMQYNKQEYAGYQVEVRTGGGRYDYAHIPEIMALTEQIKELQQKAQASYRIALTSMNAISNDGELITPARFMPSKNSIILKKKKN